MHEETFVFHHMKTLKFGEPWSADQLRSTDPLFIQIFSLNILNW